MKKAAPFGRRSKCVIREWSLAERREAEGAIAPTGPGIFHVGGLLRGTRKLLDGIVTLAHGGRKLFAKSFRRLTEIVTALSSGLCESRIREMPAIANPCAILFELNLAFEISGHLVEFANYPLEIVNLSRLLFDFPTLQANGHVT
jgi:hypothetical protein